jgi:hypothetical protein
MDRSEAISLLVQSELAQLTIEERAAYLDTSVGEGLLDEQPALAELIDDPANEVFDTVISDALRLKYVGANNEYISKHLRLLDLGEASVTGSPESLAPCPCCQYRTLSQRGQYDICPVCNWEDTGVDDMCVYSGPNHSTLAEAKKQACDEGNGSGNRKCITQVFEK